MKEEHLITRKLKLARLMKGVTQEQAAKKIGITVANYNRFEKHLTARPCIKTYKKISKYFKIPYEELVQEYEL